jgi:hypothetical protein
LLAIVLIAAAVLMVSIVAAPTLDDLPSSLIWPTPEFWPLYLKVTPFVLVTISGGLLVLNLPRLIALQKRLAEASPGANGAKGPAPPP